jgi:hypothetical protein
MQVAMTSREVRKTQANHSTMPLAIKLISNKMSTAMITTTTSHRKHTCSNGPLQPVVMRSTISVTTSLRYQRILARCHGSMLKKTLLLHARLGTDTEVWNVDSLDIGSGMYAKSNMHETYTKQIIIKALSGRSTTGPSLRFSSFIFSYRRA